MMLHVRPTRALKPKAKEPTGAPRATRGMELEEKSVKNRFSDLTKAQEGQDRPRKDIMKETLRESSQRGLS